MDLTELPRKFNLEKPSSILDESPNFHAPMEGEFYYEPWDDTPWRTISAELVQKLGGQREYSRFGEKLLLPAYQNGELKGNIHCALQRSDLSYIYDAGPWNLTTLFPYDYTRKILKRSQRRVILIGEGPRDALHLLDYDVPTLANLGGVYSWSKAKAELIAFLNPELIILAFDPDEIGKKLYHKAREDLRLVAPVKRLKFRKGRKGRQKEDPGNMAESRIYKLYNFINPE